MKTNAFDGKVCWITGASSGIGEALALALNARGATLILSARNEGHLGRVKEACAAPEKVHIVPVDLEQTASLPAIAESAWHIHGRIDYAFLNAGLAVRDMTVNITPEVLRKVIDTNFMGAAVIARTLLPHMLARKSGTFVVTSSLSGKYGIPKLSAYAASKHALHGFFGSLRAEYAKDGIVVTMVIPGLIRTGISEHALTGSGGAYGKMMTSIAAGMMPDECARQILRGVLKRKNEVIVGRSEQFTLLINRLFPDLMAWIIRNHPLQRIRKLGLGKKTTGGAPQG